ncbi:N-acetylmuramoyl-L-alanine amidase [Streptomyces sp. NPDC058045]|uniref:N-acetylmuramoyl-L-alanine amidase n=1 Tax=Streptomyces sp. NPDC058045 TaxID=3346311 RepID=UPI0036E40C6E
MASPLSADRMVAALSLEGVHVAEHAGWRTHNRNSKGAWGPVNGILIHHTAGSNSLGIVWSGRSDLPGPLAHTHLAKNGTATMVGNGRANHAGPAAVNAFTAVLNESETHPRPSNASGTVDGNARLYGIEIENLGNGRDPYPAVQYQAAVRWAAAICRAHGWSANSVVGHKETSVEGKVDPSFLMDTFRADVAERLRHSAAWSPGAGTGGGTTTPNPPKKEKDMQLTDQVAVGDWQPRRWPDDKGLKDKRISVETALGSAYGHSRVAHEGVDALRKEVAEVKVQLAEVLAVLKQGRA